jgi:UDP-N-acetylmuramyl tripeptide synthase
VDRATAAVITNVAADHLGEYGINTVEELIEAKFIVRKALFGDAPLILNADDEGVVAFARSGRLRPDQRIVWASLEPGNPVVRQHLAAGGEAALLRSGWLELVRGDQLRPVIQSTAIPATRSGIARHNIRNALSAVALCDAMGVDVEAMRQGLAAFRGDAEDNPGRGNWFEAHGVRILLDFAHNEHGFRALTDMLSRVPAERRILLLSQAGDRSDEAIADMTAQACTLDPTRLLLCDLPGYERGREPGEVPALIEAAARQRGVAAAAIEQHASPVEAVAAALDSAQAGDLLILLVLTQRDEALRRIRKFVGESP